MKRPYVIEMITVMLTIIISMMTSSGSVFSGAGKVRQIQNNPREGPALPICYPRDFVCDGKVDCPDQNQNDEDFCPTGSVCVHFLFDWTAFGQQNTVDWNYFVLQNICQNTRKP